MLWSKFACDGCNRTIWLDLADGAAIREIEITACIDGKAAWLAQTGLCAFGIKVIADCRITNKSGSGTIWLDFADDEVTGVHDINDTGIVNSNAGGVIEAGHSACPIHIAFGIIPAELASERSDLTSRRNFSDGIDVAEVEIAIFINGQDLVAPPKIKDRIWSKAIL